MNNIADILSRKPFFDTPKVHKAEHFLNYVVSNSIPKTLKLVCDVMNNNRWRFYKNNIHMKPYYVLRKKLTFHDGVILRKQISIIPHCLRRSILRLAHEEHIGIAKCKARLQS